MSTPLNRMVQPSILALSHACSDVARPAIMILAKDGKRYIIGQISEGFQRSLGEQKVKSSRLQGLWLTGRLEWSNVSGLPGYLLSVNETANVLNKMYWGIPDNINKMASTWKYINWHDQLNIESVNGGDFSDNNLEISPFLVLESTCYIIQMQPAKGKFLAQRAIELGVPPGKMFGKLHNGSSVTLENGTVVHPYQVVEPGPTPTRFVVLDLPTTRHLERALENNYQKRKRDSTDEFTLDVVYYFLGEEVDPQGDLMTQLLAKFPSKCRHYVSHPGYCSDEPVFKSLDAVQGKLREIVPGVFPIMRSSAPRLKSRSDISVKAMHNGDFHGLEKPSIGEHEFSGPEISPLAFGPIAEPTITTLGTGASCPSKYRNVSATVVRIPTEHGTRALLFDCGEGTTNSLRRLHSHNDLHKFMLELDILYISHMHADHHLGTLELLKTWQSHNPDRTINLFGPEALYKYLQVWAAIDANPLDLRRINFIDLEQIIVGQGYGPKQNNMEVVLEQTGLANARACKAIHCSRSYSGYLAYTLANGQQFRVAYSGDTRPSPYFASMAKGATVLIHEATHEDELLADAKAKRHSTVSEAAQVASEMEAEYLILTHFSQRYPKVHSSYNTHFKSPTCFGFDGMQFGLSRVQAIQDAMPAISKVFEEVEETEEVETGQ